MKTWNVNLNGSDPPGFAANRQVQTYDQAMQLLPVKDFYHKPLRLMKIEQRPYAASC